MKAVLIIGECSQTPGPFIMCKCVGLEVPFITRVNEVQIPTLTYVNFTVKSEFTLVSNV